MRIKVGYFWWALIELWSSCDRESMAEIVKCPLCSSFAAKSLKGVIRHLGLVHAHDAGFYVRCEIQGCPRTYNKFYSYKKHNMYSKHRDILIENADAAQLQNVLHGEADGAESDGDISGMDTTDSTAGNVSSSREAALFVLKARHVHKVAQSSISELLLDFTTLLEGSVHQLHSRVSI